MTKINPVQKLTFLNCIVHEEVFCKTVLQMKHVADAVAKTINFVRARALNHKQFIAYLEKNEIKTW